LRKTLLAAAAGAALVLTACGSATPTKSTSAPPTGAFKPAAQDNTSALTVWVDSTRLPMVQAYQKAHPGAKLNVVTYSGDANGTNDLQTKVQLFDRSGRGWPDVVFSTTLADASWTSAGAKPFAAPVDEGIISGATLSGFAKGTLDPCRVNGHVYCLRNDLAQGVLWYNKALMDKWGYQVPTTWEQYEQLGHKVAKEHPGYLVGDADIAANEYLWASQCPADTITAPMTVSVNLQDPHCTRMTTLMDNLIKAGSFATQSVSDASFIKNNAAKVLMMPGPSWFGQYVFNTSFKVPAGQIAAAPPLKWAADSHTYTGDKGGGLWFISSHSKNLKAAADVVTWLTTSNTVQASAPTYPAFAPAAKAWLANPANTKYFANDVAPAFEQAATQIWPGWTDTTSYDVGALFNSTVLPNLGRGKTITSQLPALQTAIKNKATSLGYKVN
jgi:ABC-type glycerol-3-phosphate transport system substrate-binding protein